MSILPRHSLDEFSEELLPLAEQNPDDPEFIIRLREWDRKHVLPITMGLRFEDPIDIEEVYGVHRFLFETQPGDFPITRASVEHTRHQTNRYVREELKWNTTSVTSYRLPQLLIHSGNYCCESCQGDLNYHISKSNGIVFECSSCGGVFPLDATGFDYPDRFDGVVNVGRPATKSELLKEGLFPDAG